MANYDQARAAYRRRLKLAARVALGACVLVIAVLVWLVCWLASKGVMDAMLHMLQGGAA